MHPIKQRVKQFTKDLSELNLVSPLAIELFFCLWLLENNLMIVERKHANSETHSQVNERHS